MTNDDDLTFIMSKISDASRKDYEIHTEKLKHGEIKRATLPNHEDDYDPLKEVQSRFDKVEKSSIMNVIDEVIRNNDWLCPWL